MPAKQFRTPIDGRVAFNESHEEYVYRRIQPQCAQMGMFVPLPPRPGVLDGAELPPSDLDLGRLPAYIHTNRWLVKCDNGCGDDSHSYVWLDSLWYMCIQCFNRTQGGYWRPVYLPRDAQAIVGLLDQRPPHMRNWVQTESLEDLKSENRELGVPV